MNAEDPKRDRDGRISVLVEMRAQPGMSASIGLGTDLELAGGALRLDPEFVPVAMGG